MSTAASPLPSRASNQISPLVVMGVCGCGKTSVGKMLASNLGYTFIEGDSRHSSTNVEKMSKATRHIVSKDVIEALGPDGMLINISRASNIDEDALLGALESGALGSAALDVFEGEPKLNPRFLKLDNVLVQPHHASGTVETRKAMGKLVRDNLAAHFAGAALPTPVI